MLKLQEFKLMHRQLKTKLMIMGSLPYVAPIDMNSLPPVVIHGTNIKYVDKVKNIGVWTAPTLD